MTILLQRGDGAALWKQIADALEDEIKAGVYEAGDGRLPTERDLTDRFQVNRHTVRRAISALAETGLVRTEQGRGAFVNVEMVEYPLGRRVRFAEALSARQRVPVGRVLERAQMKAAADVAAALELKPGAPVWRIERLGSVEHKPLTLGSHYFCRVRFPNFRSAFGPNVSITEALARFGVHDYQRRETRILARPASAEEARLLELPRGRPVLVTEGVNIDDSGIPVEFSVARFAADRVQLVV